MTLDNANYISIFDTTLRDGGQSEDVSFSVNDKIDITHYLSDMGIHYIEGGWPGSNPKDEAYFSKIRKDLPRLKSKITCFSSTRRKGITCEKDPNIKKLIQAEMPVVCVFGKSWDMHVRESLAIANEENLEIIGDSISYLKKYHEELVYDAEHFFDGYKANPEYAIKTIQSAESAGADCIVLCDTNGSTMPWEIEQIVDDVRAIIKVRIGIHTHNDSESAVANALYAVKHGASMVQGTINGFGERCGNCNLVSVIANLKFKMNLESIPSENIEKLTSLSSYVWEKTNITEVRNQPFVGRSAFAHKGGIHVSAVMKNSRMYEHIAPSLVGNNRRVLISDLSGVSNVKYKLNDIPWKFEITPEDMKQISVSIKQKENEGYVYESADASFELEVLRTLKRLPEFFTLVGYHVFDFKTLDKDDTNSEASVQIKSPSAELIHTAALGKGPVDALSTALKKALSGIYDAVNHVKLTDYKVRILDSDKGTAARTRVLICFEYNNMHWETVGVHYDIIRASYIALVDSMNYLIYHAVHLKNA